jgi:murein DD-endopeptidase MepM/ murein hydrolase activator NlpD
MVNRIGDLGNLSNFSLPEGDRYLTQPGDTMVGVANYFGLSTQELANANPFIANPNGLLPPGIYLNIPKKRETKLDERPREREQGEQKRQQEEKEEKDKRLSLSNLETVSNNPVANTKRNYELVRGELSLSAINLVAYKYDLTSSGQDNNVGKRVTTGKYTREYLLTDETFLNKNSMNANDIQKFLHQKGSGLATYLAPDGRSASELIFSAAVTSKINPQLLLVLLQREGGFITGKYASNIDNTRLEWAFGFGTTDRVEELRGFSSQIEWAACQLKQLYNQSVLRVPGEVIMDGVRQKVDNAATMVVYQLGPKEVRACLFYEIWQRFFGKNGLGRLL